MAAIPVNEVTFERGAFVRGKDAYLGYLASALDVMGITDDFAKQLDPGRAHCRGARVVLQPRRGQRLGRQRQRPALVRRLPRQLLARCAADDSVDVNYVMKRYGVLRDGSNLARSVCQFNENCGPCGY